MRWEYHTERFETSFRSLQGTTFNSAEMNERLNVLGSEGWELVNVFDITKVKGGTRYVIAVLKRQRHD